MSESEFIAPAAIGEYLSFNQCSRYFKHRIDGVSTTIEHNQGEFTEAFNPLNVLLSETGEEFESEIYQSFKSNSDTVEDLGRDDDTFIEDHDTICEVIASCIDRDTDLESPHLLYQPTITGEVGVWDIGGHADFVVIWPTQDGVELRVVDAKSTKEEKTYHQIQAAIYTKLISDIVVEYEGVDVADIEFSAGIITRESEYAPMAPDVLPKFNHTPRVTDVTRLLSEDGDADTASSHTIQSAPHQIDSTCAQCPYNEGCITDSFEEEHIRLLGLTESEQQLLANHGVEDIHDLSELCTQPDDDEWNPVEQKEASFERPTYRDLKTIPGFGEKLPDLVYRAQALREALSDEDEPKNAYWIPGTGRCRLPEDAPVDEDGNIDTSVDFVPESMIRVYLNIQQDHLRSRVIQVSGRVSVGNENNGIDSIRFSEVADAAPTDENKADVVERELLTSVAERLQSAIQDMSETLRPQIHSSEHDQNTPLLHFYTYTESEFEDLIDALGRHDDVPINAFTDLLEGAAGADKPRVSYLKPQIQPRIQLTTPSYGLLHVYDEVYPPKSAYNKPIKTDGWEYMPPHTDIKDPVDIRRLFGRRLFNTEVNWENDGSLSVDPDGYDQSYGLKSRYRFGAEIPLGYIWAAVGRIDDQWVSNIDVELDGGAVEREINSYRYHNASVRDYDIRIEDVEALGRHLCDCIEHVERSLVYRDRMMTEDKQPINTSQLDTDTHETPTIAEATKEYLWIEHTTQQANTYEHYRKLPLQRILSGESIPVKIKSIDTDRGSDLSVYVTGELPYDHRNLFGDDSDRVKRVCKVKGGEQTSSGDWMVANPFDPSQTSQVISKPYEIESGINATIERIDMKSGEVVFELRNTYWPPGKFGTGHRNYVFNQSEEDEHSTYIDRNEWLILDPLTDNISADRAYKALDNASVNELHTLLERLRWGEDDAFNDTRFDPSALDEFSTHLKNELYVDSYPNTPQQSFIETDSQVALLQGPPGTGKTAGTLAPTLCARMYAAKQNETAVSGLVTAPSNTAIDELVADTAELVGELDELGVDLSTDEIRLIRLTGTPPSDEEDHVEYLDYRNESDAQKLISLQDSLKPNTTISPSGDSTNNSGNADVGENTQQRTFGEYVESESETDNSEGDVDENNQTDDVKHTIIFATPTKSWGLLKHLAPSDADPIDIATQSRWNLLVADEASMLTLPQLILAGVGVDNRTQVLLGGDHRQLPPVQKHEWDEENRRGIKQTAPHLSALDYMRVLAGDEGEVLDEDGQEEFDASVDTNENPIPMVQLNTTYRFESDTADFIGDTVYTKDNIDYTANGHSSEKAIHTASSEPIQQTYDSGSVTLVTYDADQTFQQVNIIEATMTNILLQNHHEDATAGVVTPHNAQRSRLSEMLYAVEQKTDNSPINLHSGTQVETVNRFQGGEKDVMIMSATVSDPQFIRSEDEFLLESNRANVAFTRHKRKLIVVMAESLLSHIPKDPDVYEDALLWKQLPEKVGEPPTSDTTPVWSGTLTEFASPLSPPPSISGDSIDISIYPY